MKRLHHPGRLALALLAVLAAGLVWLAVSRPAATTDAPSASIPNTAPAAAVSLASQPTAAVAASPVAGVAASAPPVRPAARSAGGVFESDAAGRLLVDERTRLAVESLVALNAADALPRLMEAEVQGLPPSAAAAAHELVQRFEGYQAAQRTAFPPGQAPLVPQEGLAELDAVVALRSSYFGADAARRMFGADEAVARRLLQLMAEERNTTLSMEQKATRAQQRFDQERATSGPSR